LDDYDEILHFYNLINRTEQDSKKLCYQKGVNLIFKYIDNSQRTEIENKLIIILNLFFVDSPDHFHSQGKDYITLDQNEKSQVLKILKKELRN